MTATGAHSDLSSLLRHADEVFIGGQWVASSMSSHFQVIDSFTEAPAFRVAEAGERDVSDAVGAARQAFDDGPWPRLRPDERARYVGAIAAAIERRGSDFAGLWTAETGTLYRIGTAMSSGIAEIWQYYADLAETFEWERRAPSDDGGTAVLVEEPVGVVGAIIPWNAPLALLTVKVAPALLAGCTVVLKASPEAPGEAYLFAEIAAEVGLPGGVVNVLTADRAASELLVRDARVDKITFTGSTAAGRRIAGLCSERIARCTLELGGKSAALVLDDYDLERAADELVAQECLLTGQMCDSLTRVIVGAARHDELVDALRDRAIRVRVGDPHDDGIDMGPLATDRQRDRVEGYVDRGICEGATLVVGGRRPAGLGRGFFFEPTVFAHVANSSTIAQDEIFGPVLCVIPARDENDAVTIANDTIFGLNNAVFTTDAAHAYDIARRLRSGTVGHNAKRSDFAFGYGGFKQSGVGREGGVVGLGAYLEAKTIVLDA